MSSQTTAATAPSRRPANASYAAPDPEPPSPGGLPMRHRDDPRPLDEQFRRTYPDRQHRVGNTSQEAHNFSRWCWSGEPADWHSQRLTRAAQATDAAITAA